MPSDSDLWCPLTEASHVLERRTNHNALVRVSIPGDVDPNLAMPDQPLRRHTRSNPAPASPPSSETPAARRKARRPAAPAAAPPPSTGRLSIPPAAPVGRPPRAYSVERRQPVDKFPGALSPPANEACGADPLPEEPLLPRRVRARSDDFSPVDRVAPRTGTITNHDFETLCVLFRHSFQGGLGFMPWSAWLCFMQDADQVEPASAAHTFPDAACFRPETARTSAARASSKQAAISPACARIRQLFIAAFPTGTASDLPPRGLDAILDSPDRAEVMLDAHRFAVAKEHRHTESTVSTRGLCALLLFTGDLLRLLRADPGGLVPHVTRHISERTITDDNIRRTGLVRPACPAERHTRSAMSLLWSNLGNHAWQPHQEWGKRKHPDMETPYIRDCTLDTLSGSLRWAWRVIFEPATAFPQLPRPSGDNALNLDPWDAVQATLIAVVSPYSPIVHR